jgi:ELP3 family radical SAM enzyme/protein acetyltransferase
MSEPFIKDIEDIKDKRCNIEVFDPEKNPIIKSFVLVLSCITESESYNTIFNELKKRYKILPKKRDMNIMYQYLVKNNTIQPNPYLEPFILKKPNKSWSGVIVVTIVMKPDKFSCPENCDYCPNQTIKNGALVDMPRSYLDSEPAVKRAIQHNFDTFEQFMSRLKTLQENGHKIDKIEIILEGGTFSSYNRAYQVELMRDIYYAANTYFDQEKRQRNCLEDEQTLNETSKVKIIGITIETRPDHISRGELRRLRSYGVTRIQLGVQSIYNDVLKYVNRNHYVEDSIRAIKDCKNSGFDIHISLSIFEKATAVFGNL